MLKAWMAVVAIGLGFLGAASCAGSSTPTSSGLGGSGGGAGGGAGGCAKVADCPSPKDACSEAACSDGQCSLSPTNAGTVCAKAMKCDGKGECVACIVDDDCPAPSNDCESVTCEKNACKTLPRAEGTATKSGQVAGDCKQRVCDGAGMTRQDDDDSDAPDDHQACTIDACASGMPTHDPAMPHTACTSNDGGKYCGSGTKAGVCVECLTTVDCTGTDVCDTTNDNFACVPATCTDAVKDGQETGIDCGGPDCSPCAVGGGCTDASDCASGFCNADTCAACTGDGDCGDGDFCDTASGVCTTDKGNGQTCSDDAMCTSGNCVDGVCCNTACDGVCSACSAAKKGQGTDGTCGAILLGDDPDHECTAVAGQPCGKVGMCNGAGACKLAPSGLVCNPAACNVSTLDKADTCDGSGHCVDNGTQSCSPYLCNSGACPTTCSSDPNCIAGDFCLAGACIPKRANGTVCSGANQCASGSCADGVCCNSACTGTCTACNLTTPGVCAFVDPGSTDPDTCSGTHVCAAGGACLLTSGNACAASTDCATGFCVDGFCCGDACAGPCRACSAAKNGGSNGVCGNVVANTDPDNECANGFACAAGGVCQSCTDGAKDGPETDVDCGGGACPTCANGKHCIGNTDCASNVCSGGVCIAAAVCGNGMIEIGETCDDSNTVSGDGCSSTCACEASRTKTMSALALGVPDDTYNGSIASMTCVSVAMPTVSGCATTVTSTRVGLGMDHTWVGDLVVKVVAPDGTVVTLMSRPDFVETADDGAGAGPGSENNLVKTSPIAFFQGGPVSAENLGLSDNNSTVCQDDGLCSYAPNHGAAAAGDLTSFNGKAIAGTWKVCVGDAQPGDVGVIDSVSLVFTN